MSNRRILAIGFALVLLVMSILVTRAQDGCNPALNNAAQGDALYTAGDYTGAIAAYNCALQARPDSAALFNLRGNAYRQLGNYTQALADYNRAIELDATVAVFYNNRGYTEYKQGAFDAAQTDLNKAIELDANLAYAYNNRGLIYAERGQIDLAAADFRKAIALGHDPISWPTINLANLHVEDVPVSDVPSIEVTALDPTAEFSAGVAAYRAENFDLALEKFNELIAFDPDSYVYYCERANVYYAMGEYQKAIYDYTKAIDLKHMAMHYTWRGNSYAELGETDKALEDYAAALRAEPTYANANLYRALLYHQTGEDELARADFNVWADKHTSQFIAQPTPESGDPVALTIDGRSFYKFAVPVKKGQVITIETATPVGAEGANVDPILLLVESGVPQIMDDDGGDGHNALISKFVVPGDCVYDLYVLHSGAVGPFTLTITIDSP